MYDGPKIGVFFIKIARWALVWRFESVYKASRAR